MKAIPQIQKYMTTTPHTIGADQTLKMAMDFMSEYKIRHLPILNGGKIFGILSDRDVKLATSIKGVNPELTKVEEVCHDEVYIVKAEAMLDEVASEMAEKKYGSALVTDNNKLVGIFTAVDGLKALADLLHTRLK